MGARSDHDKAKQELGFSPPQLSQALRIAYEDFVRRGLISLQIKINPASNHDPEVQTMNTAKNETPASRFAEPRIPAKGRAIRNGS